LRLRIAADIAVAPIPGPCTTPQYSQTEDYRVSIGTASIPLPQAAFTTADRSTCSGRVAFRDASQNAPTAWRWDFGDGSQSTLQHPTHNYALPGVYSVRLRVCNSVGCDSIVRTNYIRVRTDGPRAMACQPATQAYCCTFGLSRVQLASIDHAPGTGAMGYVDASCNYRTVLTLDQPSVLRLSTGSASTQDIRVYLDLNDDGVFDPAAEKLYEALSTRNPSTTVRISSTQSGLVLGRALRLRVCADHAGSPATGPCSAPLSGQVADYSVVLQANQQPPRAGFSLTYQRLCGPVQVAVTNAATGTASYRWNFGDGTTSSLVSPPVHTYTTPGVYQLTQVVSNAFGVDTARHTVVVARNCPLYCLPLSSGGSSSTATYFTRVWLTTLDNQQPRAMAAGYNNFTTTAPVAELQLGRRDTLLTESPPFYANGFGPWAQVSAWIDYNQDGNFSADELIGDRLAFSPHLLPFQVPPTACVGATRMRVLIGRPPDLFDPITSCPRQGKTGTAEDYTVLIQPAPAAPQANFAVDFTPSCTGLVQFQDRSAFAPTRWAWDFGDGTQSPQQDPQHQYSNPGVYTVALQVTNRYGTHHISRPAAVTVNQTRLGVRPAACFPINTPPNAQWGLFVDQVSVGAWTYTNPLRTTPYVDETCTTPVISLQAGQAISFMHHRVYNYGMQVKLWLDCNDDGRFDEATELLYSSFGNPGVINPKLANLAIPASIVLNRPLRLRIWWMADGSLPATDGASCFQDPQWGQVRDFAAVATPQGLATRQSAQSAFELFPNPAQRLVNVTATETGPRLLRLFNSLGQQVLARELTLTAGEPQPLHLPSLPAGVYWVSLEGIYVKNKLIIY